MRVVANWSSSVFMSASSFVVVCALAVAAQAQPADPNKASQPSPNQPPSSQPTPDAEPPGTKPESQPVPTTDPKPEPGRKVVPDAPKDEGAEKETKKASEPTPTTTTTDPLKPIVAKPPVITHVSGSHSKRRYFVKGSLSKFSVGVPKSMKKSSVGVAIGVDALPNDADALINTFFLTIEPQIHLAYGKDRGLKMGFGVPLRLHIADFRGSFERCLDEAKTLQSNGADDATIAIGATACVQDEKDNTVDRLGKLRKRDWDERSDYAKVIRYIRYGGEERNFYLNINRLFNHSVGHGPVIRNYNPNLNYNTTRVSATFDAYKGFVGFESMINDIVDPDVMGVLAFVRPFEMVTPNNLFLSRLSFGVQASMGLRVPTRIGYENGLFDPSKDLPIPQVDGDLNVMTAGTETVTILGLDVETKLIRTQTTDLKVYADIQQMVDRGKGYTAGALLRMSFGQPATSALRLRAEAHYFEPNYLPQFFDTFYDIQKLQFMPAGYRSSDNLIYFPTKLQFLDANEGGKMRAGGYFNLAYSFLNKLTFGISGRFSKSVGTAMDSGFTGIQFDDISQCNVGMNNLPDCTGVPKVTLDRPRWGSLKLHVEIPFRDFLQSFATYEIFSTSLDGEGLDLFKFSGDNEVFLSGLRLKLLPIMFIQGELRRFYFLQRVTNVDLQALTFEQDQNFHSEWTFAVHIFAGLEF